MSWYVVDCESDGPVTGTDMYSLVCLGIVRLEGYEIKETFYGQFAPISNLWIPEALAVSGFTRDHHLIFPPAGETSRKLYDWTLKTNRNGRPTMWSDNIAYDWMWPNYYLHKYAGSNPFGFSGRRIADLACGLEKSAYSKWKKLRRTKHDHNPVNDAIGNAEALITLCKQSGIVIP